MLRKHLAAITFNISTELFVGLYIVLAPHYDFCLWQFQSSDAPPPRDLCEGVYSRTRSGKLFNLSRVKSKSSQKSQTPVCICPFLRCVWQWSICTRNAWDLMQLQKVFVHHYQSTLLVKSKTEVLLITNYRLANLIQHTQHHTRAVSGGGGARTPPPWYPSKKIHS